MKAWILRFFGNIGSYISILFENGVKKELEVIMPLAAEAVKMVASDRSLLTSGAKRDAAIAIILAKLVSKQTEVAISMVNLAIELAYVKFKAEQPKLETK